jgi:hypothetical protein
MCASGWLCRTNLCMDCIIKASYSPQGRWNFTASLLRAYCKKTLTLASCGHRCRISLLSVHEDNAVHVPAVKRNTLNSRCWPNAQLLAGGGRKVTYEELKMCLQVQLQTWSLDTVARVHCCGVLITRLPQIGHLWDGCLNQLRFNP